jgi:raffinose/stachyose/melibiose transport system substrate-binding protein
MKRTFLVNLFVCTGLLAIPVAMSTTPIRAQEGVTLVVWDNFTRESEQAMVAELHGLFEDTHPGVTVQRESFTTEELTNALADALASDDGPDVALVNQSSMGNLRDLLLPLDDYANEYDWYSRYALGLHARNSASENGLGSGNLYGMSNVAEVVGVFYHRDIFAGLGIEVPRTFEQFEAALATLKEAGYTPITFGNAENWVGIHTYGALLHSYTSPIPSPTWIDILIYHDDYIDFDNTEMRDSATKMLEWLGNGYFSANYADMNNDVDALGEFVSQTSAMWLAGSWNSGAIIDAVGEQAVGFFLLPSAVGSPVPYAIGGVGLGYGIRATSDNADLAAEYIDLLTNTDAGLALLQEGYLPAVSVDTSILPPDSLTADLISAWFTINTGNAVGHYLDWGLPNAGDNIEQLVNREASIEEFIEAMQTDFDASEGG